MMSRSERKHMQLCSLVMSRFVIHEIFMDFHPTAHKGCRGIVFTHGVRMGGRSGEWREKVFWAVSQKP